MIDIQNVTKELEKMQTSIEESKKKRNRLEGELDANEKILKELEERCQNEVGVPVEELPKVLTEYENKIDAYMKELRDLLGGEQ